MRKVSEKEIATTTEKMFIRVSVVYYSLDGGAWCSYDAAKRGFYVSVHPVKIDGNWTVSTAFSGYKKCVLECSRFSQKSAADAEKKATEAVPGMIAAVCQKNGLTIAE